MATLRIVRVKIGLSWPEDGMRKWEVSISRTLRESKSIVLRCQSLCIAQDPRWVWLNEALWRNPRVFPLTLLLQ